MRSERVIGQRGISRGIKRFERLSPEEVKQLRSIGGASEVAKVLRMGHETARELMSGHGMVTPATLARVRARLAEVMVG